MFNKIKKIRDYFDSKFQWLICIDDEKGLAVLEDVFTFIGKDRVSYEIHKGGTTKYMMEIRIPDNRYMPMMKELQKRGWNLAQISNVGVMDKLIKL